MTRIGINIDHVATIRNARGEDHPNVYQAAKFVSKCKVYFKLYKVIFCLFQLLLI